MITNSLEQSLQKFPPDHRYLVSAELEFPKARGTFQTNDYLNRGHVTTPEMLVCYAQLSNYALIEALKLGEIRELSDKSVNDFMNSSLFITEINSVRFRRPMDSNYFNGVWELEKVVVKKSQLYLLDTSFNFEDDKATGQITLALKLKG